MILGNGGHAQEVRDIAEGPHTRQRQTQWPGDECWLAGAEQDERWLACVDQPFVLGTGTPSLRRSIATRYWEAGCRNWPALIHPSAVVSQRAAIGDGVVIAANTVIAATAKIGRWALINYGATVGHDVQVGEFCVINPGAHLSGGCVIEDGALVGVGASVLAGVHVGAGAIVGANAVCNCNVPSGKTVVGCHRHQRTCGDQ